MGRTVIVTGTGNNGSQPWHAGGILQQGKTEEIQLAVGAFEPTLNVQLWKDYEIYVDFLGQLIGTGFSIIDQKNLMKTG